jgi:hypothetical protein
MSDPINVVKDEPLTILAGPLNGQVSDTPAESSTYTLVLTLAGDELPYIGVVTVIINEQTEYMSSASNTKSFVGLTAGIDYPFTVVNEGYYFNVPVGDLDNCTTNITGVNKPMMTPSSYTINILGTASFKINVVS